MGTGLSTGFRADATEKIQRASDRARMFQIAGGEGHFEPTKQIKVRRRLVMES